MIIPFHQCCGTVVRNNLLRFQFRQVTVTVPAPYLDHKKLYKSLAFLMFFRRSIIAYKIVILFLVIPF
jgi:hypothetical protein